MGAVAKVALKGASFAYDKLYTYAIPKELLNYVAKGCRVLVPFGKGNLKKQGMVFNVLQEETDSLKTIFSVTDETPVLSDELLSLCEYMRELCFCTYYDAVSVMLPAGLEYKTVNFYTANEDFSSVSLLSDTEKEIFEFLLKSGEREENAVIKDFGIDISLLLEMTEKSALIKNSDIKRKIGDATQKWVKICVDDVNDIKLTPKQNEVVGLLQGIGGASVKEICYFTGVTQSVIDTLVKKGILGYFNKKIYRIPTRNTEKKAFEKIRLTDEQQKAFEGLIDKYNSPKGEVALLYGITGSGKTRVFSELVEKAVNDGKGVIVMVPEIALTPQTVSAFTSRFGEKVAVFHSALSMGERMDEWQRIKDGRALIAIGTRSAVFAPFKNLGLIIMDEEQEHTYKSEKTPRYNTRDIAKFRTAYNKGLLCLSSATPSIETFTYAKNGKYSVFKLLNRYGNAVLPETKIVDMRSEIMRGNTGILSEDLYEELKLTLNNKKQAIILLNRRGHNTYVSCPSCGNVVTCPNCSISLTYHSANNRLMCHYCGYSEEAVSVCKECGNEHMHFSGLGTQKAEQEIKAVFPDAKILRLDADSTTTRDSYENYLTAFANGEYDILLGTQMVAKGLDFENVTLVGVLGADFAAMSDDFRSFERMFSLLTQVVGRAGRGDTLGKAIIQTANPDNEIIELAKRQDYDSFYEQEILTRKLMVYPPYCDICVIAVSSMQSRMANDTITEIFGNIKTLLDNEYKGVKLIILGPSPASIAKVNGKYRFRMIIKCKNNSDTRKMIRKATDIKIPKGVSVSIDMNPQNVI